MNPPPADAFHMKPIMLRLTQPALMRPSSKTTNLFRPGGAHPCVALGHATDRFTSSKPNLRCSRAS